MNDTVSLALNWVLPFYTLYLFSPSSSDTYTVQLQEGDTLLLATDGLWDNVHIEDILSLIPQSRDLSENNLSVWNILIRCDQLTP